VKVGFARPLSAATEQSLVAALRCLLAPEYLARAREVAALMTNPAESAATAADRLEDAARVGRSGRER
jgi:UDP:flavonoid glycosyltransferase YjiC (YdhE family)